MSRKDAVGFFWEDLDDRVERKRNKVREMGWIEIAPGYWCEEKWIQREADGELDEDGNEINFMDYVLPLEAAYAEVKGLNIKREPPYPFWREPGYLPKIDQAFDRSQFVEMTDEDVLNYGMNQTYGKERDVLVWDIECYPNYFLIAFKHITTGQYICFELDQEKRNFNRQKLNWVLTRFTLVGFNSIKYDMPMTVLSMNGASNAALRTATCELIEQGVYPSQLLKERNALDLWRVIENDLDHIDLIEVAPLFASLKIYGGRMGTKRMQDLPFEPETLLTEDQKIFTKWYCMNDLAMTEELFHKLKDEIDIRVTMSNEYYVDLRSKSDAQIAEAVIKHEYEQLTHQRAFKPIIEPGTWFNYRVPQWMEDQFQTPLLQEVLNIIRHEAFVVSPKGSIGLPKRIKGLKIKINNTVYKMGIGGLHSTEKKQAVHAGKAFTLKDWDVTSYYPYIILNSGLYPEHLGPVFLTIYRSIVDRRVASKRKMQELKPLVKEAKERMKKCNNEENRLAYQRLKAEMDKHNSDQSTMKIVINGSFGKFGSKFSILYSPNLLIQTTITGQLSLLLLIERLELNGIEVVSANTDGIVVKTPVAKDALCNEIMDWWQDLTEFGLEANEYEALYSRDVNNYIAIKKGAKTVDDLKTKGIYAEMGLRKTPGNQICSDAVKEFLLNGKSIAETVRSTKDPSLFVTVRTVKGGAVIMDSERDGTFLGKAIRYYHSTNGRELQYATNGNRVPQSDGCRPLMEMTGDMPDDIDYQWYIDEAEKHLRLLGVMS